MQSSPLLCIDDHQFEQRGTGNGVSIVKSLLSRRPENACILARVTIDIPWSVNSLASAGHKMDESFCGRRLALLISTFTTRMITGSVAVWETLRNSADCDCFSLKTQSA